MLEEIDITEEYDRNFRAIEYWTPHFSKTSIISLNYYNVSDRTKLLVIEANRPQKESTKRPVIMLSGWASLVETWSEVLQVISDKTDVYYIETRDKTSSILPDHYVDMTINQMVDDLEEVFLQLPIEVTDAIILCSSLGGTQVLEYLRRDANLPKYAIMVGPNPEFHYPWVLNLVILLPLVILSPIKRIVKWYLRNFRIDMEKESEQYEKYAKTLDTADDWKIREVARKCLPYKAWSYLKQLKLDCNVILAGAKSDKMHTAEMTERVHQEIVNSEYVDFPTNKSTHSQEMADFVLKYI